jgi:hypothetical protein
MINGFIWHLILKSVCTGLKFSVMKEKPNQVLIHAAPSCFTDCLPQQDTSNMNSIIKVHNVNHYDVKSSKRLCLPTYLHSVRCMAWNHARGSRGPNRPIQLFEVSK